ncbi:glycosyltransferase family 2 protein [Vibrio cholerae]
MVSVIISVLNRVSDIKIQLDAIISQTYQDYEVIYVDNGSSDGTKELIESYANKHQKIKLIDASHVKGSPYSARNIGIREAKGDIIAFLDGYPEVNWLENAVAYMRTTNSDMVSGRVVIEHNKSDGPYKCFDAIFSLDTAYIVKRFRCAPTANLFIKRDLLDDNLFRENIRSGGDIDLTSRLVKNGHTLNFCHNAVSKYFSRDKYKIINKQKRVALGQYQMWVSNNRSWIYFFKVVIALIRPIGIFNTKNRIKKNSHIEFNIKELLEITFVRNKLDKIRLLTLLNYIVKDILNENFMILKGK